MGFLVKDGVLKKYIPKRGIRNVVIPYGINVIGSEAFGECKNIQNVTIPDSVTIIGDWAFWNCTSLRNIKIPDSVRSICSGAFCGCTSLKSFVIPDGVKYIDGETFEDCISLENIIIPEGIESISYQAFSGCSSLKHIAIPNSIETMDYPVFDDCEKLERITLFGFDIDINEFDFYDTDISDIRSMLKNKNYNCEINKYIKFSMVSQIFLQTGQPEAESYIKNNFEELITYFIDKNDYDTFKKLLDTDRLVNENNIMKIIDYSIKHTQESGDLQIQAYIMDYKNRKFPDLDPMENLKL